MKTCVKCGGGFPATVEYFYREKTTKDGLKSWCKKCHVAYNHNRREQNREMYREYNRKWRGNNIEKVREALNCYRAKNPWVRISNSVSGHIRKSLADGKGGRRWELLVGYTLDDLMSHLELQFKPGMLWDNFGEWHIDHIRPVSDFHFESCEDLEFKQCWSLWNLQPMWGKDNLSKGNKCDAPPLPLHSG